MGVGQNRSEAQGVVDSNHLPVYLQHEYNDVYDDFVLYKVFTEL